MRKIKIFYSLSSISSRLDSNLGAVESEVNSWLEESGSKLVDIKMTVSPKDSPVVAVIYDEPEKASACDSDNENAEWQKGYESGYHAGSKDRRSTGCIAGVPEPPKEYDEGQQKSWKAGFEQGYLDARCGWLPRTGSVVEWLQF